MSISIVVVARLDSARWLIEHADEKSPVPVPSCDGVGDVRPFGAMEKNIVEGVY